MRMLSLPVLALLAAPAFAAGGALPKAAETPDGQVVAGKPVQAKPAPAGAKKAEAGKRPAAGKPVQNRSQKQSRNTARSR